LCPCRPPCCQRQPVPGACAVTRRRSISWSPPRSISRVGSPPALPPTGTSGRTARPAHPARFARALDGGAPSREAEREGASVASGCGGEGAGPEVPVGGSERGGGGGWGTAGRSEPSQGSHVGQPPATADGAPSCAPCAPLCVCAYPWTGPGCAGAPGSGRARAMACSSWRPADPCPHRPAVSSPGRCP